MTDYPTFSDERVNHSIATAKTHSDLLQSNGAGNTLSLDDGMLKVGAECISVTVNNNQVCLNLPLGIGGVCLPVPSWIPNGTAAQACLAICTKWGIPCGIEVTVSVAGQVILQKNFGCSC